MVIFIFYILSLFLLIKDNNKIFIYLSYILMIILFCFNLTNADREIYENRLYYYDLLVGSTEVGYYYLMEVFTKYHLEIQNLYIVVGILYLSTLFYIISKLSKNQSLVISSYMIGAFLFDVVQLRFTLSLTFVLWGFYFLLSTKRVVYRGALFSLFIIVASTFHSSSLFYLVFVLSLFRYKIFVRLLLFVFFIFIISSTVIINYFGELYEMGKKIEEIQASDKYVGNNSNLLCLIYLLAFMLMYIIPYKKVIKGQYVVTELDNIWYKINITCVLIIPIILFSADVRRIFVGLLPLQVSVMSHWITPQNSLFIKAFIFGISFFFLYFFILRSNNIETVFYSIFENNLIL